MDEKKFKDQISFVPRLEGNLSQAEIARYDNVIVGGMGGSALPAKVLFFLDPTFPLWLHDDYGLPAKNEGKTLYVASSYSGNTAETLSFAKEALEKKHSTVTITSGGTLLEWTKENGIPYILVPQGFYPRDAVIYMLRALLYVLKREELFEKPPEGFIDYQKVYEDGRVFGNHFAKKIPLIYASRQNQVLSYIWKIMLNETGKIPAFANHFPELAHNEAQGLIPKTAGPVARHLKILLLLDREDDERIQRGMKVFQQLASAQSVDMTFVELPSGKINKFLHALVAAGGAAHAVAELDGVKADGVPFIELFKKSL